MITSQGLAREPGASRFILALFPFRCLFESLRNNGSDVPKLYPPIARSNRACVTAPWAWDAAEVCRLRSERHRLLRPAAPLGNPSVRYSAPVRLRATLSGPGSHGRDLQRPQIRPKDFNDRLKLRSAAGSADCAPQHHHVADGNPQLPLGANRRVQPPARARKGVTILPMEAFSNPRMILKWVWTGEGTG